MATSQQIENLLILIRDAEEEGSITNEMVAEVLDWLKGRVSAALDNAATATNMANANKESINLLLNNNASTAIDNFKEILAFLKGLDDSQTLEGIIAELSAKVEAVKVKTLSITPYYGKVGVDLTLSGGAHTYSEIPLPDKEKQTCGVIDSASYEQIKTNKASCQDLNQKVNQCGSTITNVNNKLTKAEGNITTMQGDIKTLQQDLQLEALKLQAADVRIESELQELSDSKGQPDGIAPLDKSGKVPAQHLPGYVDDVVEFDGFVSGVSVLASSLNKSSGDDGCSVWFDEEKGVFVASDDDSAGSASGMGSASGASTLSYYANWQDGDNYGDESLWGRMPWAGKVYIDVSTNKSYRWSGSQLSVIGSDLALGHTSATAFPGDEGIRLSQDLASLEQGYQQTVEVVNDKLTEQENSIIYLQQDLRDLQQEHDADDSSLRKEIKAVKKRTDLVPRVLRLRKGILPIFGNVGNAYTARATELLLDGTRLWKALGMGNEENPEDVCVVKQTVICKETFEKTEDGRYIINLDKAFPSGKINGQPISVKILKYLYYHPIEGDPYYGSFPTSLIYPTSGYSVEKNTVLLDTVAEKTRKFLILISWEYGGSRADEVFITRDRKGRVVYCNERPLGPDLDGMLDDLMHLHLKTAVIDSVPNGHKNGRACLYLGFFHIETQFRNNKRYHDRTHRIYYWGKRSRIDPICGVLRVRISRGRFKSKWVYLTMYRPDKSDAGMVFKRL